MTSLSHPDVAHLDDPAAHLTLSHLTDTIDACVCCGVAVARRSIALFGRGCERLFTGARLSLAFALEKTFEEFFRFFLRTRPPSWFFSGYHRGGVTLHTAFCVALHCNISQRAKNMATFVVTFFTAGQRRPRPARDKFLSNLVKPGVFRLLGAFSVELFACQQD